MRRAIVLQHVPFEGPARLAPLLEERGYILDVRRLDRGEAVPEQLSSNEILIVMGGPMGIADLEGTRFPFLEKEVQLLRWCVAEGAPVLGICLGAQLLAFAAGADVHEMVAADGTRRYEVGWATLQLHAKGADDALLHGLPAEIIVLHWHGDQFELPQRARLWASTTLCNQAFQLDHRLFGLQFHCEVGEEEVERFLQADAAFVDQVHGAHGAAQIQKETAKYVSSSRSAGDQLLRNILDAMMSHR